jgi:hypothetical protein
LQLIEEWHSAALLRRARNNTSGYLGVWKGLDRGQLVYLARATSGGEHGKKLLWVPASKPGSAEECAEAYDRWAIKAHGRCAARPPAPPAWPTAPALSSPLPRSRPRAVERTIYTFLCDPAATLTIRDEKQQQVLGADGVVGSEKGSGCPQMR